jgi:hypothetical protein
MPQWTIASGDQNAAVPTRQLSAPLASNWVSQVEPAGTNFAVGVTELTFAQWMPVYHWALDNGYTFDYDGDMGSMDYWGWGTNWMPGVHGPDEPVTGMTRYDAMTWLNALSELEGRTPVYRSAGGAVIRTSYMYRPLQLTLGEGSDLNVYGWADLNAWPSNTVLGSANGYRLPQDDEYFYAAHAGGSTTYPWGTDVTLMTNYAWVIDNSGLRTHDVAQKTANSWGLYDMVGNVNEWSESQDGKLNFLSRERLGLGFFDLSDGYPEVQDRGTWSGLAYPDLGFRVFRQKP